MSLLILVPIDENKSKHAGNYFLSVTWDLGLQRKGTYQNSFVPVHTSQLLITDDYPTWSCCAIHLIPLELFAKTYG